MSPREISKVFIIDDQPICNKLCKNMLSYHYPHFHVNEYTDANAALNDLEKGEDPDLIILDIQMKDMSGWNFLDKFNSSEKKAKVLIVSNSPDYNDFKKAKNYDRVYKYIIKPLDTLKVANLLEPATTL
ncbi:response regulator [Marinigracilibium pacificum]|uniref:Response regulator n=1 Tax=Marinigracilibium pacificum TaxID=2729599 RepID=A0A848IXJ3_9BACT|nr:response regulator [Marinigracilibium pacificum]NMM46990.1 response regulator [Marinigracilibium pacificum]